MTDIYKVYGGVEYLAHNWYDYVSSNGNVLTRCSRCEQNQNYISNAICYGAPKTTTPITKKEALGEKIIFTKDFAGYKEGHIFFINKLGYYNESRGIMKNIQKDIMELLFKEGIVKNYVKEKTILTKQEIAEKLGIKVEDLIIKKY